MFKTKMQVLMAVVFMCLLSSCATLKQQSEAMAAEQALRCANPQWEQIGYQDGLSGKRLGVYSHHEASCTRLGYGFNRTAYSHGHSAGLMQYCVPQTAYQLGAAGDTGYQLHTCPLHLEQIFLTHYIEGLADYRTATRSEYKRAKNGSLIGSFVKIFIDNWLTDILLPDRDDLNEQHDYIDNRIVQKIKRLQHAVATPQAIATSH